LRLFARMVLLGLGVFVFTCGSCWFAIADLYRVSVPAAIASAFPNLARDALTVHQLRTCGLKSAASSSIVVWMRIQAKSGMRPRWTR
jgi:hypothetical protein